MAPKRKKKPRLLNVEFYIETAALHGDISDGDHEPGDLCVFLRRMWRLLTPEQRLAFARDEDVRDTLQAVRDMDELTEEISD